MAKVKIEIDERSDFPDHRAHCIATFNGVKLTGAWGYGQTVQAAEEAAKKAVKENLTEIASLILAKVVQM